jgi:uncharacterized low-complexity protein
MNQQARLKPIAAAVGAAFTVNLAMISLASAANPFAATDIGTGYQVAEQQAGKAEGKCGEGKCGASKKPVEGKCGEGKCGAGRMDADYDDKLTKDEFLTAHEEMFAVMDADGDGAVDNTEMKAAHEGRCGEGKCGVSKP